MKIKFFSSKFFTLCSLLLVSTGAVYAEDIIIPIASQGRYLGEVERPKLGETSQQVANKFGEPVTRHPATGKPPISRWDYQHFSVYFESDTVLHSVLRHRRADTNTESSD